MAAGQIKVSPLEYGLVQLLADNTYAIWYYNPFSTLLSAPGTYMSAPAVPNRVCGGHILMGDVTGDGVDDLIQYGPNCNSSSDSGFEVWAGTNGGFQFLGYVSLGAGLRSMQIGDLNGDHHDDLAFSFADSLTSGDGAYAVALYDPSLQLANQPSLHFGFSPAGDDSVVRHTISGGAGALALGDVAAPASPSADGDGHPDLVVAQPQSGRTTVLANDPSAPGTSFAPYGTPAPFAGGSAGGGPDGIALGKVDRDNRIDLLAWSTRGAAAEWDVYTATRPPTVSLGSSASGSHALVGDDVTFTATVTAPAGSPQDAAVDHVDWDFDGDGTTDQTTTGTTVTHAFATTGDMDVTATVVNTAGDRVSAHLSPALRIGTPLHVTLTPNPSTTTPGTATDYTANATGGYPGLGGASPSYTYSFSSDASTHAQPQPSVYRATWAAATRGSVSVSVDDGQGQTATDGVSVRVADALTVSLAPQNGQNLMAGEARTLVATAGGGIGTLHYAWDLDGNGSYETDTGTSAQTPATFASEGTPSVGVKVTDSDPAGGVAATATRQLIVRPQLTARIDQSPSDPAPGATITFDAVDSTGGEPLAGSAPYTYAWTIDGTPSGETGAVLTHSFSAAGRHTVVLTIGDAYGRSDQASDAFKVAAPLVADFTTAPASPQLGEDVHFDPSTTSGGVPPYSYAWDLDGDGTLDPPGPNDAAPTHAYATSGVYQVELRVTDSDGVSATVTKPVGVAVALTAALRVLPAQPAPGAPVTFDGSITVGGTPPYHYAWTLDGVPQTGASDDTAQLRRTFANPGRHTVALTVTDATNRTSGVVPTPFKVAAPVVAAFTSAPALPQSGQPITLDAGGSSGGLAPLHYAWDLDGDGTYETDGGTTASTQTTFAGAGVHTIGLRVTDDDGVAATIAHVIQVAPALTAALTHTPAIPAPGQQVTLDASGSGGGAGATTYAFDVEAAAPSRTPPAARRRSRPASPRSATTPSPCA